MASFIAVMRQDWRDLLFLHWRVDPAALAELVPRSLVIDTWDGAAWVGLVPFRVERLLPALAPPFLPGISFGEVNVRTYATPAAGGDPGVWFMSLDAGSRVAAAGARLSYSLPYFSAQIQLERVGSRLVFRSRRRDGHGASRVEWRPATQRLATAPPGSLDEFLIERYVLYAEQRGRLLRADVEHESYLLACAELLALEESLLARAGVAVAGAPLIHYSPGVDVRCSAPRRVGTAPRESAAGAQSSPRSRAASR